MSSIHPAETTPSNLSPMQKVVNYLNRKGKLELWSGVIANQMIQDHQAEQKKNQAAEGAFVRRQIWGESPESQQAEDMANQTILGDVTHPTPIVINGQQSSGFGRVLAGLAIGALIPAAGIGGYLLNRQTPQPSVESTPVETETVNLGLLRLEDLTE
jgi:hypothetical protein